MKNAAVKKIVKGATRQARANTIRANRASKFRATSAAPVPVRVQRVLNTINSGVDIRTKITEAVGIMRQAVQARRGSYRSTLNPRSRMQTPYGGSGDQHVDVWSQRIGRELSRDLDRNGDVFKVLLDTFAFAVVGNGVKVRPTTKDQKWNDDTARAVDAYYSMVRGGADSRQQRNMYGIQHDFVRAVAADGEAGMIKLRTGRVCLFEADQLVGKGGAYSYSPKDINGVLLNESGAATGYNIASYGQTGSIDWGTAEEYDSDKVEFVALMTRFSQTRGMPMLIAALEDWERLDSYRESEIIAAEQGSQLYGAIERPVGDLGFSAPWQPANGQGGSEVVRGGTTAAPNGGEKIDWQNTVSGSLLELPNGAKYVPINPQRPNRDCAPFLQEILRMMCSITGIPYEITYSDLRGLSWSINRALVQLARDRVSVWQTRYFGPTFSQLYYFAVQYLVSKGVVAKPPADWMSHELAWPEISWPDEGKEFEAQAYGLLKGLLSRSKIHGPMWRDVMKERATELDFASDLAREHNTKFPEFPIDPMFYLGFEGEASQVHIEKEDAMLPISPDAVKREAAQTGEVDDSKSTNPADLKDGAKKPPTPPENTNASHKGTKTP